MGGVSFPVTTVCRTSVRSANRTPTPSSHRREISVSHSRQINVQINLGNIIKRNDNSCECLFWGTDLEIDNFNGMQRFPIFIFLTSPKIYSLYQWTEISSRNCILFSWTDHRLNLRNMSMNSFSTFNFCFLKVSELIQPTKRIFCMDPPLLSILLTSQWFLKLRHCSSSAKRQPTPRRSISGTGAPKPTKPWYVVQMNMLIVFFWGGGLSILLLDFTAGFFSIEAVKTKYILV